MTVLGTRFGRVLLGIGIAGSLFVSPAFAQNATSAPLDPYPYPSPPPGTTTSAPVPTPVPAPSSGTSNINTNTNTANPTNTVTANPTQNNTSTNDNRSNATVNNTIYIYPPTLPPPPPPVVAPPTLLPPMVPPPQGPFSPPPLVPPPPYGYVYPPRPYAPYARAPRIRLSCAQMCGQRPAPIAPLLERVRYVSLGAQATVFGMANQPLAGWSTLVGGGVHLTVRSRGRFGFEISQDFLRGELRASDNGLALVRNSFPFQFTLKGYILPNSDKHHFNMYFGGGVGAMASNVDVPLGDGYFSQQTFLEWMVHGDVGAELRFRWFALGADARITALVRDNHFADGAHYGDIQDAPVPAKSWGVQGRGYLSFWF